MDVWRQRMDATTNWAVATSAGMMTFTFTAVEAPHFIMLMALSFDAMFLFMESRRYQVFDLWRRRFRTLNHYMIAPTLIGKDLPSAEAVQEQYASVASDLGRTVPHLRLMDAVGYRIRRNYGYLFTLGILAWLLKLEVHPATAGGMDELAARAAVGGIPGPVVMGCVAGLVVLAAALGLHAPSEGMLDWAEVPSPLGRWVERSRKLRRAGHIHPKSKPRR